MKKNQLSKLALMGLATGAMITSTAALSANTVVEANGTYLAGGCGAKCSSSGSGTKKINSTNYTADTYETAPHLYDSNITPKPADQNMSNGQGATGNGHGSCSGVKPTQGQVQNQGSCSGVKPTQGQGHGSCAGLKQGHGGCGASKSNN